MKYLNYIVLVFFILFFSYTSVGQSILKNEVQFSAHLGEVRSIQINQSQFNINLSINTLSALMNGLAIKKENHIEVTSTSEYQIQVVASSELEGEQTFIPVNTVSVIPSLGSSSVFNYQEKEIYFSPVSLSTHVQNIITSGQGEISRFFDVSYQLSSWLAYIKDHPSGSYRTTITYSIVAN
ncbi:hypothetical protein [Mesonia aestuariivivens]|uniref:DUF4402 domain-containing protein n=1 Tax=Mesonia aestuariivivens TaxID=2796128 RepID=A0ABS6W282_9FLAO|nr:hypothetical protein [Mesonia aestuariivivens]MBW2961834.1 hypothetical protein [Mesonia aestuariivivens]